jgi:hypothetical protein
VPAPTQIQPQHPSLPRADLQAVGSIVDNPDSPTPWIFFTPFEPRKGPFFDDLYESPRVDQDPEVDPIKPPQ